MKLRKTMAFLLAGIMVSGTASIAVNAAETNSDSSVSAGSYSNVNYLETYASSASNETNLGSTYSKSSTTWKTWSPDASAVKLKLYKTGSDNEGGAGVIGTYDLSKNSSTGVWSLTMQGDYKNVYYTYLVTVKGNTKETQDVYSKATGVNGKRSMVVDLDSTDPDGWNNDKHVLFNNAQEAVVWEVHVRDFSIADNSGVSQDYKGKYLAFTEGGTTLNSGTSASDISTGVDYLVSQGINCVQLMPVYDFGSVDESVASTSTNRNWGYDPVNYNVPEGSYSTNAYDGNTRITEFKQMIQALHDRGISVVMDVVYNHTYSTDSCFTNTVPGYYYRMKSSSDFYNGSGCGNETASDKLMYRKYMKESILYWADEYHIDGFRFDLMGLHDVPTMNQIRSGLDNLYADGSGKKILMYGEPWTGGTTPITDGCTKAKAASLDARVGMFNDDLRDAIKGGTDDATKGFVQGNTEKTGAVINGIMNGYSGAKAPSQTIAYADAHDNLILWDKIITSNGSSSWNATGASYINQLKAAMGILLTSQGIPFMTAGSEFCRTKQGDANSYASSDDINAIDWKRVKTYSAATNYYKGLLEIRKNYSPLKGASFSKPTVQSNYGYVVAYTYSNNTAGEWGKVAVLVNSGTQAYTITLDGSGWTVVANGTKAGLTSLGTVSGNTYSVPARSACVLVQSSTFNNLKPADTTLGTLNVNHVDENGNLLKTTTAKYRPGSTYRALPDPTIMFDYKVTGIQGEASGIVSAGQSYSVTYTYKSTGVKSGYLTTSYVDQNGVSIRDSVSTRLRDGDSYSTTPATILGYQLDTDKYPSGASGTFDGDSKTITYTYKPLSTSTVKVHYLNSNGWNPVQLYSYTGTGEEPNGKWANATVMTSEGNSWYTGVVPVASAYVMFHPSNGSGQEPAQGADGYLASGGEVWIEKGVVSFNSTVITSHIDAKTGKKLSADVVVSNDKITSAKTYTTSALPGRTDVEIPSNASGNCAPGVINVVYLYGGDEPPTQPTTEMPTEPTTEKPTEPTEPTTVQPTTSTPAGVLIGDVNLDKVISVDDSSILQKAVAEIVTLTGDSLTAGRLCDRLPDLSIKDVTCIQAYVAELSNCGDVGKYTGGDPTEPTTVKPTEPTTEKPTQPTTEVPTEEPTTVMPTEPTTVEPTDPPTPDVYNITFSNNKFWSAVYCYFWADDDTGMTVWPGENMTYSYTNDFGEDVYVIEIPGNAQHIIFTDGTSQTVDIDITGDARYYISGGPSNAYTVETW